jgi:hypothetical protein
MCIVGIAMGQINVVNQQHIQSTYSAQLVSSSPSLMNGLSKPATTLSQSGQLLASTSSNSALILSAFFPPSFCIPTFLPPPMPGIQPTGADTTVARASGTMRSRSLSPADRIFRPSEPAARVPPIRGSASPAKPVERRVRCATGAVGSF